MAILAWRTKKTIRGHKMSDIELIMLIVIMLIGLGLAFRLYAGWRSDSRDDQRRHDMRAIQYAIGSYYAQNGYYPPTLTGLAGLSEGDCRAPRQNGNCQSPDYKYQALNAKSVYDLNLPSNCDNKKPESLCVNYILSTDQMESANNPYVLTSY